MNLQPIVYVTDMDRSQRWYRQLLQAEPEVAGGYWTSFSVGGGHLALHLTDEARPAGNVELSLVSSEPLEGLIERMEPHRGVADEAFGRSVIMSDPDGSLIQVNEHDPELYQP